MRVCSPREFVKQAREQGLRQVLFIGCAMVLEVMPQRMPQGLAPVLAESPDAMLAARVTVERLLAGEAGTARGPEIWGIYLQSETTAVQRWRRRLMFFIPTNEDYQWTSNHRVPLPYGWRVPGTARQGGSASRHADDRSGGRPRSAANSRTRLRACHHSGSCLSAPRVFPMSNCQMSWMRTYLGGVGLFHPIDKPDPGDHLQ